MWQAPIERRPVSASWLIIWLAMVFSLGPVVEAQEVRDVLADRWEGRWVIIHLQFASSCDGIYTNVRVSGDRVKKQDTGWEGRLRSFGRMLSELQDTNEALPEALGESRQFAPGEIGSVRRVEVKRERVDLLIEVGGRVLLPRHHGAFTLYEEADCKVKLQVEVPKKAVQEADLGEIETALTRVVSLHDDEEAARSSAEWNGRGGDQYPDDYQGTLARYRDWSNAEIERALAEAKDILIASGETLSSTSAYLSSFVRGINRIEPILELQPCETLVGSSFEDFQQELTSGEIGTRANVLLNIAVENPGNEGFENYTVINKEAYVEGQHTAWALVILERLPECRVPESGEGSS